MWTKGVEYRATTQKEKRKTTEKISGCGEEEHKGNNARNRVRWRQMICFGDH